MAISFPCGNPACGKMVRAPDGAEGKKARCPLCSTVQTIPTGQPESSPPPLEFADEDEPGQVTEESQRLCPLCKTPASPEAIQCGECGEWLPKAKAATLSAGLGQIGYGKELCPSCHGPLPASAKICVRCGIYVGSGRPILTVRDADLDELEIRADKTLRVISWLIPIGIDPIYSEARGRHKPYVTWGIAILTILTSVWFLAYRWTGSPKMHTMKNLMLWAGKSEPAPQKIFAFYAMTNYGDSEAFFSELLKLSTTEEEFEKLRKLLSEKKLWISPKQFDPHLIMAVHKSLKPEQQCFGRYRHSQLITHAFLHGGILHLAGNLLFLFVLGSRVNTSIGNIATAVLYLILAVLSGLAQKTSLDAGSPMPMIGASGAVMGMAGMYLVLFPLHRIYMVAWWRWGLIRRFRLSKKIFSMRGFLVVLFYIAFDMVFIVFGMESSTAHWAHLGGFLAGAGFAVILLILRLTYSGGDLLSCILGKYAWPLIGAPATRMRTVVQAPSEHTSA